MNKIKKYSDFLDGINRVAYKDVWMLSNPTLSKNPYTKTKLLHNIIDNKIVNNSLLMSFIFFYIKNILLFISFLFVYAYSKFYNDKNENISNNMVLIDSFYGDSELSEGVMKKDNYFLDLYNYMEVNSIDYCITPKFYNHKNPLKYIKFIKTVKNDSSKTFIDVFLLTPTDLKKVFKFLLFYPFAVFKLRGSVKGNSPINKMFKSDLMYSLSGTDFYPYIRYLFGRRLSKEIKGKNIKVISWCEYQVYDKNFYKGLRSFSDNLKIYGTQFLFKFPTYSCLYIPESDQRLGIAPDTILVTGDYYIPSKSVYSYKAGPAFRYSKIYHEKYSVNKHKDSVIVMLPYVQSDAFNIIKILKGSHMLKKCRIDFKIHPDFVHKKYKYTEKMEEGWKIIEKQPNLNFYSVVISSGSGSVMEFACSGLSVIIIKSFSSFTTNPMPEAGKGENWNLANNKDIDVVYDELLTFKKNNIDKFKSNVIFYRDNFLSQVTPELIRGNFDFHR